MALIENETIRAEIERRLSLIYLLKGDFTDGSRDAYEGLLSWLDTLPEQPEPKPKAIVIRPAVNLQKELMGVSAEVKDAVMLLLKDGWSLKAPDSEREFDQRAVCAGLSSIPPKFKLDVKPEQLIGLDDENAADKKAVKEIVKTVHKEITRQVKEMVGKQPVTDCHDLEQGLEEEIDKYCQPIQAWEVQEAPFTSLEKCARHFAEWGAEHAKK